MKSKIAADRVLKRFSRKIRKEDALKLKSVSEEAVGRARKLAALARQRGQTLTQLAVTWILRQPQITSVLIGASRASQVEELHVGLSFPQLTNSELAEIE